MEKYCKKCDTTKPVSEFHKSAAEKDGLNRYCKECRRQEEKERYKKNKERLKKNAAAWKEKNPDYHREWRKNNPDYFKEWRKNNPDYHVEWRRNNPDRSKEYSAEYYEKNKERVKKNIAAWQEKNPHYYMQYKYGLSQADYNKLLEDQDYACAICGGYNDGRALVVDHDHSCCPGSKSCGKCVRQLLCGHCNSMLGFARDNPEILEGGAKYVKRHGQRLNIQQN